MKLKPAPYPPNTAAEIEAIVTFEALLDKRFVIPHLNRLDKVPNNDGHLELIDEARCPIGKLEVQVRKIPDATAFYRCPVELIAYSERISLPFLLVCVDVGSRKAYFRHLYRFMSGVIPRQKTFTIEFDSQTDCVSDSSQYLERWREIVKDYNNRIAHYHSLVEKLRSLGESHLPALGLLSATSGLHLIAKRAKFKNLPARVLTDLTRIPEVGESGGRELQQLLTFFEIPNPAISYELVESPVTRSEAELLQIPELAAGVRLNITNSEIVNGLVGCIDLRRLEAINVASNRERIESAIGEGILSPPERLLKFCAHWNFLPAEAIREYHVDRHFNAIPYYHQPGEPGWCVLACCAMATKMMFNYTNVIPPIAEIVRSFGDGQSPVRFQAEHATSDQLIKYVNTIPGIRATLEQARQEISPCYHTSTMFEAVRSYVVSGFPVILVVDMARMAGCGTERDSCKSGVYMDNGLVFNNFPFSGPYLHCVLAVGADLEEDVLVVNDPATLPFIAMNQEDFNDITNTAYSDTDGPASNSATFIPVLPSQIKMPIIGDRQQIGLELLSLLARHVLHIPGIEKTDLNTRSTTKRLVRIQDLETKFAAIQKTLPLKHRLVEDLPNALKRAGAKDEQWIWIEIINDSLCLVWSAEQKVEVLPKDKSRFGDTIASVLIACASITDGEISLKLFK